ncbi:MAG: hypothetical protein WCR21_02600 [Bacteroidota bacterium]
MKNKFTLLIGAMFLIGAILVSCDKKDPSGIGPTYGSTGNPNANNQTTTGSPTYSSPATDNTSMGIGGIGWSNPSCATTNSLYLKSYNGVIDVTLTFPSLIKAGLYSISQGGEPNTCALTILNAPNQPSGISWYGKSGLVTVSTSSSNISASFNGIICTQQSFNYPTVTASGNVSCSQ